MLKAATARAHDQEERRKKDTDALNGLDGLARRVWYRNERVRRNQEGGIGALSSFPISSVLRRELIEVSSLHRY